MESASPNSCSLEGGELLERIEAWRGVSLRATSREVQADTITSVYPSEPEVVARLKDLIAAEGACCSFLRFTLNEEPHQTTVVMTFPPETRSLIESVISVPAS